MKQRIRVWMTCSRRPLVVASAVVLLAVLALPAVASSPDGREASKPGATAMGVGTGGKMIRVVYDPETGEIRAVPVREGRVLSEPLATALSRSTEGLRIFDLSNGGKGVYLGGRFQHAMMVRRAPDGSYEMVCTSHSDAAEDFLKGAETTAASESRDR